MHYAYRFDRMSAVLRQTCLDGCRIGAAPPVAGEEIHLEPEPAGQALPERSELAGLVHQHALARRERIDQRRLPRAGARRRIDDDRMPGLKHVLHPLEHLFAELGELRPAVIDSRMVDRAQHPVRNIGRARDLQKMAAGV